MSINKRFRPQRRRTHPVAWTVVFLLIASLFIVAMQIEQRNQTQMRGIEQQNIGQRKRTEYQGVTYAEKTDLTALLLLGTDRNDVNVDYGARRGGQADFQLLLVIDPEKKCIHQLQIDRDTITDVEVLGIFGNSIGLQPMQISLAHAFGTTPEECNNRAIEAVERMLPGLDVDLYITLDLASIGILNDVLGGVTVTLEDDFSAIDPAMSQGTTLTLNAQQAEIFVRSRMSVGDGTNQSRMYRQRAYMSAAKDVFKSRMRENPEFANQLLDALENDMTTDASRGRLLNEANQAYSYQLLPIETLPGEHAIGKDGFMEYHLADGAALDWVMRVLYEPYQ